MREIDIKTLTQAARDYAGFFLLPTTESSQHNFLTGPERLQQDFYNFTFKDEFEFVVERVREELGASARERFDRMAKMHFTPRDDKLLEKLLKDKLAVDLDGNHMDGQIGSSNVGGRLVGFHKIVVEDPAAIRFRKRFKIPKSERKHLIEKTVPLYWPIYAGETEERLAGSGVADPLPDTTPGMPVGATNTRISNEVALLMADAAVDQLDEGAGAAVIQGRSGSQPTDPDTAVSGTLLFTLVCSGTAFGNAADAAPGATATADSITDDTSADNTETLGYCRASSTADGATPADDHVDGEAGTSSADFNFNTVAIVAGATVSLTSWTITMPES